MSGGISIAPVTGALEQERMMRTEKVRRNPQ